MRLILSIIISLITFVGCAGKVTYTFPTGDYDIKNTVIVNLSKDDVWKRIIPRIGQSFFVLNNIDKESGLINISYSGDPEKYVDCGMLESYVKNAHGERTYRFPAAKRFQRYETLENGIYLLLDRKMDLEGRINIILQEIDATHTKVVVNVKYILTKSGSFSPPGNNIPGHFNDTISFNTLGLGTFPNPKGTGTTCCCNGVLEKELLALFNFETAK